MNRSGAGGVARTVLIASCAFGLAPSIAHCKCVYDPGGWGRPETLTEVNDKGEPVNRIKVAGRSLFGDKVIVENQYHKRLPPLDHKEFDKKRFDCQYNQKYPDWKFPKQTRFIAPAHAAQPFDAADLNGDGLEDVVEVRFGRGALVAFGQQDGRWANDATYDTGGGPEQLVLADVNNDGAPDLIVVDQGDFQQQEGGVYVFPGVPDGTFAQATRVAVGRGARTLAVADFNGDQIPDLAVGRAGSLGQPDLPDDPGDVKVLLGDGGGGFQAPSATLPAAAPNSLLATDLDLDGDTDLVVAIGGATGAGTALAFLGGGDGSFAAGVATNVGSGPTFLSSSDFNGDGRVDLAVLHKRSAAISTWIGEGDGRFGFGGRYVTGVNLDSIGIVHDPDSGDSRPTILAGDSANLRLFYHGVNLDGSLVGYPLYLLEDAGRNGLDAAITTGDFDDDGAPDIIVSNERDLWLISGPDFDQSPQATPMAIRPGGINVASSALASADFSGDGVPDLAVARRQGRTLQVFTNSGTGSFGPATALDPGGAPTSVQFHDLNDDARPDLVVTNRSPGPNDAGKVRVFPGADGGFAGPTELTAGVNPVAGVAGDFNEDGRTDLAVINQGDLVNMLGGFSLFFGGANGGFSAPTETHAAASANTGAVGDFNRDGHLDMALAGQVLAAPHFTFGVAVLLGAGDGTFGEPTVIETSFGPAYMAATDYNGDGNLDLVIAHCCGDTDMTALLGDGDGGFSASSFPGGPAPRAFAAADFDKDGDDDLAILSSPGPAAPTSVVLMENRFLAFENVSAASNETGPLAPDSIVSAYGAKLATAAAGAATPEWPEELGGSSVTIRDAQGDQHAAGVAYASGGQINYHLPPGVAAGLAEVTIRSDDGVSRTSPVFVAPVSPGFFVARSDGLAAAFVIRVKADGEQVVESVVAVDDSGAIVPRPLDLESESDRLILQLFGTGLRNRSDLARVEVRIGGLDAAVHYAGPQNQFPGLDQVNVELPRALAGRGRVEITVTVDGVAAPPLLIHTQ